MYVSYIQHNVNIYQCFLLRILTSCIMYPCITMQCDHCVLHQSIIYCTKSEHYCNYRWIQQMECVVFMYFHAMWSLYHILCIVNIDVLCTNRVRCSAIPPHSHPQLDFHHFAITLQMDRRGNCDYISNGSGQGLPSFFDLKFLFF